MNLPYRLDRTILIGAPPATVFRYFQDTARWAAWWGEGSTIDPQPGGRVYIRLPGGVEVVGEVVEAAPPDRIVFTYGFTSGTPMPAGGSLVTVRLEPVPAGTRLHLQHDFADAAPRDHHVQGWRYQLSVFANVVTDALHGNAGAAVADWFAAWAEPDAATRSATLERIASASVRMHDRYSSVEGIGELTAHIAAAQHFMPGLRLQGRGPLRHCQGMVLAEWQAVGADGQAKGSGTNVFVFGADGRIDAVTGFWAQ